MKKFQLALVTLSAAVLAAGCGGGGGGTPGASIPTAAIQISSGNASTVATGASNSSSTMTGVSQNTGVPVTVVTSAQQSSLNIIRSATAGIDFVKSLRLPAQTVAGVVYSEALSSSACATGGGSFSWNDADNSSDFSFGDTISLTYSNCTDPTGVTMNGTASFTFNTDSFTITYTGFSETYAGNTLSMAGDMTFTAGTVVGGTYNGYSFFSLSGTSMETNSTVDGHFKLWAPTGQSSYLIIFAYSGSNYAYSMDMSVASTEMGGSVSITTPTAFAGTGTNNPTTGVMEVTGEDGAIGPSKLRMTAQANGTDVLLEVDADGDTVYEWTDTVLWTEI